MNKYEELDLDIKDSFAYKYKAAKEIFEKKELKDYSRKELGESYNSFQLLLTQITDLSKEYFREVINCKNPTHDNKLYFDLSNVYISEIQNIYLNRINYRLNQKNNFISLSFACIVAVISLFFSIASIWLTVYYGNNSNEGISDIPLIEAE